MGFNKLLAPLAGVPVVVRTVLAFEACPDVHEIIVVGGPDVAQAVAGTGCTKLKQVVPGGAERHFSVWAGISALSPEVDVVAVHDGGRPLIDPQQIERCIEAARQSGAVTCARRITETMKRCDADGRIVDSIERENAWIMETPQVFERSLLENAYRAVLADNVLVTDEVSALQHSGVEVCVVENSTPNPKITFPGDLPLAEGLMAVRASP